MTTAPFDASVATLITGTHTVEVSCEATTALGVIPLAVTGGRLNWSERNSPRVTGSLRVPTPTDPEVLAALDGRLRVRVAVTVTYHLASGVKDSHVVANLGLRNRRILRPDGEVMLDLASDEALFIDAAPNAAVTDGTVPDPMMTKTDGPAWLRTIVQASLAWIGTASPTVEITAARRPGDWPVDVSDFWDSIEDMCEELDLEVYDEGDRIWRIKDRPKVASRSVLTVKGGPGGILLDSESTITRDEWANYVVIRFDWQPTGTSQDRQVIYGTARVLAGPFDVNVVGYKNLVEVRDRPVKQASAHAQANALLSRMLSRSRGLTLTAVPAWWVRPGRTLTYQPENGDEQRHLVSEVDFDLDTNVMRVVTRLPDTDSTIGE